MALVIQSVHTKGTLQAMKIYFSGGSPIVETALKNPPIMPTFLTDVKNGKPCSRLARLIEIRKKAKLKKRKRKK